jgi:hypothetical protein
MVMQSFVGAMRSLVLGVIFLLWFYEVHQSGLLFLIPRYLGEKFRRTLKEGKETRWSQKKMELTVSVTGLPSLSEP